jgi:hypothetical protein
MEMNKRTKALAIPKRVKDAVYKRDGGFCVLCKSPLGEPVAHVVRRSQGGLGIAKNIVTLCPNCHRAYDEGANLWRFGQGATRETLYCRLVTHLKGFYPDWNREDMIYRKGEDD